MTKWRLPVHGGRRYSAPTRIPGFTPITAPGAPGLGAITTQSGSLRRVPITSFPVSASYLIVEVSLNGGGWGFAVANITNPVQPYFEYDTGAATTFSFRARAVNTGGESSNTVVSGVSNTVTDPGTIAPFSIGTGTIYHVKKSGSDSNPGTEAQPFLTINRALGAANTPGCTVYVYSTGVNTVYTETSRNNAYVPLLTTTDGCDASLAFAASGTSTNPITLRAAPGHVNLVTIDGQLLRAGVLTGNKDFCQVYGLRFINCRNVGIGRGWQASTTKVFDTANDSEGCRVENNFVYNTQGEWGWNTSAIAPWCTKGWTIYNNKIDTVTCVPQSGGGVTSTCGMQAYNIQGAYVRNNTIIGVDFGIFWKDHFWADATSKAPTFESEVLYNNIVARQHGFLLSIMGTGTPRNGSNFVHHNIIQVLSGVEQAAIQENTVGGTAGTIGGYVRAEHNTILTNPTAWGFMFSAARGLRTRGNVVIGSAFAYAGMANDPDNPGYLESADFNLFDSNFRAVLGRYGSGQVFFDTFAAWKAATSASGPMLSMNNPDVHSIGTATAAVLWNNAAAGDFKNKTGSPAIGFMPDGSNAGAYQNGSEIIGTTSDFMTNPAIPSNQVATLYKQGFDGGETAAALGFGAQNGGAVTINTVAAQNYNNSVGALKGTYPKQNNDAGGVFIYGNKNIWASTQSNNSVYVRFRAKMPTSVKHGCKLLKIFGYNPRDNDVTGFNNAQPNHQANITFGLDYTGIDNGGMIYVGYGDGTSNQNDTQNGVWLDGSNPTIAGRAYGLPGFSVSTPKGAHWASSNWGTEWHLFEFYVKFNSGTTAQNEVNDGEIMVKIDGETYVDAKGLFNRHYSNLPIESVGLFNQSQGLSSGPFELWYDDLEITQNGWLPLTNSGSGTSAQSITLSGFSGAGTKPVIDPVFFQDFSTTTTGQTAASLGYQRGQGQTVNVDMTDGVTAGRGCLRWDTGTGQDVGFGIAEAFPHVFNLLPAGSLKVVRSFSIKVEKTVSNSGLTNAMQLKSIRGGTYSLSDNVPGYSGQPAFKTSVYLNAATGTYNSVYSTWEQVGNPADQTLWSGDAGTPTPNWNVGGWNQIKVIFVHNTIGSANGRLEYWVNGTRILNRTNCQPRTAVNQFIEYISLLPGFDFKWGDQWSVKFAEDYVDNSLARVELTDNAVYANSTKWAMQPIDRTSPGAVGWTDSAISIKPNNARFTVGATGYYHIFNDAGTLVTTITKPITNAFVPNVVMSFNGGTNGSALPNGLQPNGIALTTLLAGGYGGSYDTTQARPGKTSSAKFSIKAGSDGDPWGADTGVGMGYFGTTVDLPTAVQCAEGDTLHTIIAIRLPTNFNAHTNAGLLKMLRYYGVNSSGQIYGHMDHHITLSGFATAEGTFGNDQVGWMWGNEADHTGEFYANGGMVQAIESARVLRKGQWDILEFAQTFSSNPALAKRITWLNGQFVAKFEGNTKSYINAAGTLATRGGGQVANLGAGYTIKVFRLFTYWNGYSPIDQALNVDTIAFHKIPAGQSNLILPGTDEYTNKFIGLGVI